MLRRDAIPGEYIVVLQDDVGDNVDDVLDDISKRHSVTIGTRWSTLLKGAAVKMSDRQAAAIAADARVKYVEQNARLILQATEVPRSWALDRLDNRGSPRLDNSYSSCTVGSNVRLYIVDTGVWRAHDEFWDPARQLSRVVQGYDFAQQYGYPNKSTENAVHHRTPISMTGGARTGRRSHQSRQAAPLVLHETRRSCLYASKIADRGRTVRLTWQLTACVGL